jgi:hypothetical protein
MKIEIFNGEKDIEPVVSLDTYSRVEITDNLCAICDAFLGGVTGPEKIEDLQGAVIAFPSEAEPGHLYVHSDHYNKLYELDHRDGAWIIEEVNADGSAIPGKSSAAWLETKGEPISDMDTLRQRGH